MKEMTRPTIYRVMKYWGKKPHNIWSTYIEKYSKKGNYILDPFVGSGMTFFESVRLNRIPITIDINPISAFSIKCLTYRNVDYDLIKKELNRILNEIKSLECYNNEYMCVCSNCGKITDVYNYKINGNVTVSYKCNNCRETITELADRTDVKYKINKWVPQKKLEDISSISNTFIKKIGSNDFCDIWSNRNLFLLSEIYDRVLKIRDEVTRNILAFAFVQCLHLTSKMCIPRNDKSKRPL